MGDMHSSHICTAALPTIIHGCTDINNWSGWKWFLAFNNCILLGLSRNMRLMIYHSTCKCHRKVVSYMYTITPLFQHSYKNKVRKKSDHSTFFMRLEFQNTFFLIIENFHQLHHWWSKYNFPIFYLRLFLNLTQP